MKWHRSIISAISPVWVSDVMVLCVWVLRCVPSSRPITQKIEFGRWVWDLPNTYGSSLQTRGAGTCREFKTRGIQSMHQMSLKYYELSNNWLFTLVPKFFTCLFYPPKRSSSEGWRWWQLPSMEKTHRTLRRGLICFFYCTIQAKLVFKIYFYYF